MKKNETKKNVLLRMKDWFLESAYLVTIGAVLLVIVGSAVYTQQLKQQQAQALAAAADAPEVDVTPEPTAQPTVSPLPTIAPIEVHYTSLQAMGATTWPLDGDVLRAYDAQESVYWAALDSYRVHAALDIAGEAGTAVHCATDGIVDAVAHDALWGWRVAIEQTDGRRTTYAGMEHALVAAGQTVKRGQTLGTLLESIPCEAEMTPHLHMELHRDDVAQDPEGMMPER